MPLPGSPLVTDMPQKKPRVFDLEVIVDFVFEDGLLFIKLQNIGNRPARKVSVKFDHEIRGLGGRKAVSKMRVFRNIEFFAPGKEIWVFLDVGESYFQSEQPTQIASTVGYTDAEGRRRSGDIRHDLRIYSDLGYLRWQGE